MSASWNARIQRLFLWLTQRRYQSRRVCRSKDILNRTQRASRQVYCCAPQQGLAHSPKLHGLHSPQSGGGFWRRARSRRHVHLQKPDAGSSPLKMRSMSTNRFVVVRLSLFQLELRCLLRFSRTCARPSLTCQSFTHWIAPRDKVDRTMVAIALMM